MLSEPHVKFGVSLRVPCSALPGAMEDEAAALEQGLLVLTAPPKPSPTHGLLFQSQITGGTPKTDQKRNWLKELWLA